MYNYHVLSDHSIYFIQNYNCNKHIKRECIFFYQTKHPENICEKLYMLIDFL